MIMPKKQVDRAKADESEPTVLTGLAAQIAHEKEADESPEWRQHRERAKVLRRDDD
jgi:hypothetical protein